MSSRYWSMYFYKMWTKLIDYMVRPVQAVELYGCRTCCVSWTIVRIVDVQDNVPFIIIVLSFGETGHQLLKVSLTKSLGCVSGDSLPNWPWTLWFLLNYSHTHLFRCWQIAKTDMNSQYLVFGRAFQPSMILLFEIDSWKWSNSSWLYLFCYVFTALFYIIIYKCIMGNLLCYWCLVFL